MGTETTSGSAPEAAVSWELARNGRYWRWAASAQLTRLPIAMAPLAFTALTTAVAGSYGIGALIVATIVIAEVVCAVPIGRLLDRVGVIKGLRAFLAARGLAYGALLAAIVADLPAAVLIVLAAVVGALGGGLLGGLRALLTGIVGQRLLMRAVAVNTLMVDAVIVGGPVLVSLLLTVSTKAPVLVMAAASVLAAPLALAGDKQVRAAPTLPGSGLLAPVFGWICCGFAVGHLTSTIEVAVLPIAQRLGGGAQGAAGIVVVLSVASVLGGLVYLFADRPGSRHAAAALLVLLATGGAVITLGTSWVTVLIGTALTGVCIGPLLNINSILVERVLPAGRRVEGFALVNTAQGLGFGLGSLSLAVMPLKAVGLLGVATTLAAAAAVNWYAPASVVVVDPPSA